MKTDYIIYCDLDGVLTDFDSRVIHFYDSIWAPQKGLQPTKHTWAKPLAQELGNQWFEMIKSTPFSYWSEMNWTADGRQLWEAIEPHKPIILTTPAPTENCIKGKEHWIKKHLGEVPFIIKPHKQHYVTDHIHLKREQHKHKKILIDDMEKNITKWVDAGGIGIMHSNTKDTLEQLQKLKAIL